jgi:hypothetical protein
MNWLHTAIARIELNNQRLADANLIALPLRLIRIHSHVA